MSTVEHEFFRRVSAIPHHGFGLSVDVYQPDLFELLRTLEAHDLSFGYLEIFKATTEALAEVRRRFPAALLEYHAEGLWVTQPDFLSRYPADAEVATAIEHVHTLGSWWANYEGAAKQMAGYSFGTYLPPLFTRESAEVTADNIAWVQERLDRLARITNHGGPLFLLETPPLTYFGFGDIDMAEFFRGVMERVPCGVVLDIGHLWTVYRYSGAHRHLSVECFLRDFLDRFPLERVVHIHAAGLALHEQMYTAHTDVRLPDSLPCWIDSHGAAIPEVLFEMLDQVLAHPNLTQIKGLALEVDKKAIPAIVDEFQLFRQRFGHWGKVATPAPRSDLSRLVDAACLDLPYSQMPAKDGQHALLQQYRTYVQIVTGQPEADPPWALGLQVDAHALRLYRDTYLPEEILHWGGDLRTMFPETCQALEGAGVDLADFVQFWFREPRAIDSQYDFFHLKLTMFTSFVGEVLPQATGLVEREAKALGLDYQMACGPQSSEVSGVRPEVEASRP